MEFYTLFYYQFKMAACKYRRLPLFFRLIEHGKSNNYNFRYRPPDHRNNLILYRDAFDQVVLTLADKVHKRAGTDFTD